MRISILYLIPRSYGHAKYNHGLSSLSAVLKKAGHSTALLALSSMDERAVRDHLREHEPQLFLLSYSSNKRTLAFELGRVLQELSPATPIVSGGIHPTAAPHDAISVPGVHAVCRGPGEFPVLEVVRRLETRQQDFSNIPNLFVRNHDGIVEPTVSWDFHYSAEEPVPFDAHLFDLREEVKHTRRLAVMAGRGCVFRCSYCIHSVMPVGFKPYSVGAVIDQLKTMIEAAGRPPAISFHDDLFPTAEGWLAPFAEQYAREIGIPFYCQMTASCVNDRVVRHLKNAGCYEVRMGVESGHEERREVVLNKRIPNERFVAAREILGNYGIDVVTLFMIGAPYETHETVEEIFSFTRVLAPKQTRLSIFQPYPGSALYDQCLAQRWIEPYQCSDSLYEAPGGSIPHLSPDDLMGYFQAYQREFAISAEA